MLVWNLAVQISTTHRKHDHPLVLKLRHPIKLRSHRHLNNSNNALNAENRHPNIPFDCETLFIGDEICRALHPSKRKKLAVRTFAGTTINNLANTIANMPKHESLRDVTLLVGNHDLTENLQTNRLNEDFHYLMSMVNKIFPNAYITVCSLIPQSTGRSKQITEYSGELKKICDEYRYTKFIDLLSPLITHNRLQNFKYYRYDGHTLNKSGSILVRERILETIESWRASNNKI